MKDGKLTDSELLAIHDYCTGMAKYVGGFLEINFGHAKVERKGGIIPHGVDAATYDVVTNVDLSIQRQVATLLLEQYPEFEFYGEEKPERVFQGEPEHPVLEKIRKNSSIYRFVVDPLDGTGRYAKEDARFGFLIGLLENQRFVVCVAYNPMQRSLTSAVKGHGCWRNTKKFEFKSTVDDHIVINSRVDKIRELKNDLTDAGLFIMRPKHTGTMYDMLFFQYAPFLVSMKTYTHDHVLALAVEEAGGVVLVHDGDKFVDSGEYNWRSEESKLEPNIPAIVAANSRKNAEIITEILSPYVP